MNNNIPIAEDILTSHLSLGIAAITKGMRDDICRAMKEFAKLHVQAAKEDIAENAKVIDLDRWGDFIGINKDSILNAYPLDNIK